MTADGDGSFERWAVEIGPGEERLVAPEEWVDALVVIESGDLDVECDEGGQRTFHPGDMLALHWLRARNLANSGAERVKLVAVRRSVR
jgi:hypothetical protein